MQAKLAEAAELYERLLSAYPGNGDSWEKLGSCYERMGEFGKAAHAYEQALNLAVGSRAYIENQIAEMWGRTGERRKALEWLNNANADSCERRSGILSDPAFSIWKSDPEFVAVSGQSKLLNLNRDQRWQFDLDFLLAETRRLHYRYRWDSLPTSVTALSTALRADILRLSDDQIVVRIRRILARLGDGHSVAYFFGGDHGLKRLPLNLYFFSDGLYVMHTPPEHKDLVGCRVLKIGDLDPETIVQRLAPYISSDNEIQSRAVGVYFITTPEFLREIGAAREWIA
jgi:tetratricopeptide (TPR) repeat protein